MKSWTHEVLMRKYFGPRNTHGKNFRNHEGTLAQWNETYETHDDTRPTEFSTLVKTDLELDLLFEF